MFLLEPIFFVEISFLLFADIKFRAPIWAMFLFELPKQELYFYNEESPPFFIFFIETLGFN